MSGNAFSLCEGMLLGAASAATQTEGGNADTNWHDWAGKPGAIADGSSPARADDHWERWREDYELMSRLNVKVYRFGLEWARLEPERGRFDEAAVEHYREQLTALRAAGIKPLMTLHHFSNPMWFERAGAFENPENIGDFLDFVRFAVTRLGDLVSEYITINEPNVYAVNGYFTGIWPPGAHSPLLAMKVESVLAAAHIRSYLLIHELRREMGFDDTRVGFANHMRVFVPKDPKRLRDRVCCGLVKRLFQTALTRACCTGEFISPLRNFARVKKGRYCDFAAVNYYTRSAVSGLGDGVFDNVPKNDLGWEIYPEGIAMCAREMYEICPCDIYITENGVCDNSDAYRCRYIYDHLRALCESGLPVRRYYHWCFTDNWEWAEGETPRFGLVGVDYETQKRTVKRAGEFFARVSDEGGISNECYDKYVAGQSYNIK